MIVIRNVFQLEFGKARDAVAALKDARSRLEAKGHDLGRMLTDLTGEFYTLVLESEYESLAVYEATMREVFQDPGWKEAYAKFVPFVREGRREIFRVVD